MMESLKLFCVYFYLKNDGTECIDPLMDKDFSTRHIKKEISKTNNL